MRAAIAIIAAVLTIALAGWKLCHVNSPTAAPLLAKNWHEQLYGLDEHEVSRFIPPPYSPQRMQIMARGYYQHPMPGVMGQLAFYTGPGRGPMYPFGLMSERGDLKEAVEWSTIGEERGIEDPLGKLPVDGDWYVRQEAPVERRVQALQSILRQATGRDLVIEKRSVDREVVVAQGNWNFQPWPLPGGVPAQRVYLYVNNEETNKALHDRPQALFKDRSGYPASELASGDFPKLLEQVGFFCGYRVIDETKGTKPVKIEWAICWRREKLKEDNVAVQQFFGNLQSQTSLRFEIAKRPIPLWYVRERGSTTRPGSAQ